MAKRRRLEAPSAADLAELDVGFAAKPVQDRLGISAPIAQIAADAARHGSPVSTEDRARTAADQVDADSWRRAQFDGRVMLDIPLDMVHADHLVRDRIAMDAEALEELKISIQSSGQRLPIEVVQLPEGYGLISGWRRLSVVRALRAEGNVGFDTIRAILREPSEVGAAYAAMVEENEIRAQLTPYERGRISVVAAGQGAFETMEQAVNAIYSSASKAKRSKIRSFARVHEELGDLLSFGPDLSERTGLRLATALRDGFVAKLRAALDAAQPVSAAHELAVLEMTLSDLGNAMSGQSGDADQTKLPGQVPSLLHLRDGITIERIRKSGNWMIKFGGGPVSADFVDAIMLEVQKKFGLQGGGN